MAGMSEAGWMLGNPPEKRKIGSVGTPFRYKKIDIVDEHGQKCGVGDEGEIIVKGKSVGMGYLNERGQIDSFPKQGFPTGDLGYMDSDGYVYIVCRKKDLIIRGGINISPMEISNRLMEHPCVKEAVAIGVPDKIYGEEIASFIVPEPGCEINEEDMLRHCRAKIARFKLPKTVRFLKEIPKTKAGKIAKQTLLRIYEDKSG
jgi:acyl-coenzyme A synthetase/AMP-(fatty) acid ligase